MEKLLLQSIKENGADYENIIRDANELEGVVVRSVVNMVFPEKKE